MIPRRPHRTGRSLPLWRGTAVLLLAGFLFLLQAEAQVLDWGQPLPVAEADQAAAKQKAEAIAHFDRALVAQKEHGDMEGALRSFQEALAKDKAALSLARRAAVLTANLGEPQKGVEILQANLKANESDPENWLSLADFLLIYRGDDEASKARAVSLCEEAVKRFPGCLPAHARLIRVRLTAGLRDQAMTAFQQALALTGKRPEQWLDLTKLAMEIWPVFDNKNMKEHSAKVRSVFDLARKEHPGDKTLLFQAIDFLIQVNLLQPATVLLKEAEAKKLDPEATNRRLASLYLKLGNKPEAEKALDRLTQNDPFNPEPHRELMKYFIESRQPEKAIGHAEKALQLSGNASMEDLNALAELYHQTKRMKEYVDTAHRAFALYPDQAQTSFMLALALHESEDYQAALKIFEENRFRMEIGSAGPLGAVYFYYYGMTLDKLNRFDESVPILKKALEMTSEGQLERRADILNALGYGLLERDQKLDEAGKYLEEAARLQPNNYAILDSLGWFHFKKANYPEAEKWLAKARDLSDKPDAEVLFHLASLYEKQNRPADAIAQLEEALKANPKHEPSLKKLAELRDRH